jgi:acetyl-CoA C-acetyltransferase
VEALGAAALRAAAEAVAGVPIAQVILGNSVGPGGNVARVSLLEAGLPVSVPGLTVDRQCGSGLDAVHLAAALLTDDAVVLAGGVESVSTSPMLRRLPNGVPYVARARMSPERLGDPDMAEAAEIVAGRYGIGREAQDAWAIRSVARTLEAAAAGRLQAGLVSVGGVTTDEWRDRPLRADRLAKYPALTAVGATVTAANSAPPADGAAAVLLGTEALALRMGIIPLARIVAYGAAGVAPDEPGMGPVPALAAACRQAGLRPGDLDRVEINEAYAAQVLACITELNLDPERVNPDGGAIALGHPFGATGALLLVRLTHGLESGRYGAVALGIGGGIGVAMILQGL